MLAKDKVLHLVAGVLIAIFFSWLLNSALAGFTAGAIAGAGKEALDFASQQTWWKFSYRGTPELADLFMTIFGAFFGAGLYLVFFEGLL